MRARHLVLLGAVAGMAVAATVMSGAVPRFSGTSTDSATAAPATRRVPQAMARRGVKFFTFGPGTVRMVTHKDVSADGIELALELIAGVLA